MSDSKPNPRPTSSASDGTPDPSDGTDQAETPPDRASLGGLDGRGYGIVESLASLGKGRRLTGLFRTGAVHGTRLREALTAREQIPYEGPVHFRHHSVRAALEVEVARVEEEGEGIVVEFTAHGVPYGLG